MYCKLILKYCTLEEHIKFLYKFKIESYDTAHIGFQTIKSFRPTTKLEKKQNFHIINGL